MDMHENQAGFGPVAARLRSAARVLSPGAAPLARWLWQQASGLEASTATLAKALDDYRQIPADGDEWLRRGLTAVRSYRVSQATDAVLGIADEFEFLARALLVDGDAPTARACCAVADQVDELLVKAVADHPGMSLLPSKLDPRVKRWQRVTTVNAADTPGDANPRVDPEQDWAERHRATLRALEELLDEQLERNTGKRPRVRHRRGVGVYQGSTEATSLSQYPDPDGKVFEKGLGAIAAVGLAFRQKEVFLSREFPAEEEEEARRFASSARLGPPVPVMAVKLDGPPEEILGSIRRYAGFRDIPGMTILRSDDGTTQVRFMIFEDGDRRILSVLNVVSRVAPIREVSLGWSVSRSTGDGEDLAAAISNHRDNLREHGYNKREIALLEEGGKP